MKCDGANVYCHTASFVLNLSFHKGLLLALRDVRLLNRLFASNRRRSYRGMWEHFALDGCGETTPCQTATWDLVALRAFLSRGTEM